MSTHKDPKYVFWNFDVFKVAYEVHGIEDQNIKGAYLNSKWVNYHGKKVRNHQSLVHCRLSISDSEIRPLEKN